MQDIEIIYAILGWAAIREDLGKFYDLPERVKPG
jgi:hypothetical protein